MDFFLKDIPQYAKTMTLNSNNKEGHLREGKVLLVQTSIKIYFFLRNKLSAQALE